MKKYIVILLMVLIVFPVISYGEEVDISLEKTPIKVGKESTMTVTFKGNDIGRITGLLEYDSSAISYISGGTSLGDGGVIQLKKAGSGGDITFVLKFRGIKEGKTLIKITTSEAFNLEEKSMKIPSTSTNGTIVVEKAATAATNDNESENLADKAKNQEKEVALTDSQESSKAKMQKDNSNGIYLIIGAIFLLFVVVAAIIIVRKRKRQ